MLPLPVITPSLTSAKMKSNAYEPSLGEMLNVTPSSSDMMVWIDCELPLSLQCVSEQRPVMYNEKVSSSSTWDKLRATMARKHRTKREDVKLIFLFLGNHVFGQTFHCTIDASKCARFAQLSFFLALKTCEKNFLEDEFTTFEVSEYLN